MSSSAGLCWWCGGNADSREHRFKRSDVARASRTWAPGDRPYYVADGRLKEIQGPNSALVKFDKVLCYSCNTTRSQPFDRAYDRFTAWVIGEGAALMNRGTLDFGEIYGVGCGGDVQDLLRYFVKHFGCCIASSGGAVPAEFVAFLDGTAAPGFCVTLSRNAEVNGTAIQGRGVLHNFPLLGVYSPSRRKIGPPYQYGCTIGYLDVIYRFQNARRFAWEGEPIDPASRYAKLGRYVPGAPHPSAGQLPAVGDRKLTIGDLEVEIPILTPTHIQEVLALGPPTETMTWEERFDAQVCVVHAVLSPFYPSATMEFLEDNLTWEIAEKIRRCFAA